VAELGESEPSAEAESDRSEREGPADVKQMVGFGADGPMLSLN